MSTHASGTFDANRTPYPPYDMAEGATLGRTTITKMFRGDLEGTSVVEMLSAMSDVQGSAGYVAIERVTGALHGLSGSFVLQHSGIMSRHGIPTLTVSVVPDSGTGALKGIAGTMTIKIADGKHSYVFDYTLSDRA
jgi:predicted flavoprotein YhiN